MLHGLGAPQACIRILVQPMGTLGAGVGGR